MRFCYAAPVRVRLIGTVLSILLLLPLQADAQLVSPGKLSKAHAKLEGVDNCTSCHNFGDKTFRERCLECHKEIRSRVQATKGYHHTTRAIQCGACHKEHHGRDFNLIRWDPNNFDHRQAGFILRGKHAALSCRACHRDRNIRMKDIARRSAAAKSRTYLGLATECGSCHDDMHRGRVSRACDKCHTEEGWEPTGFSHSNARFRLVGRHAEVACAKCHPEKRDGKNLYGKTTFLQFTGIRAAQCTACHKDRHNGLFGDRCDKCHSPEGWRSVRITGDVFDHSVTRFQLQGRHAAVGCTVCHAGGEWKKYKGKDLRPCLLCHADYHEGQFTRRHDKGECASCHTVDGFTPPLFDLTLHAKTRFPLEGAHRAVPCNKCHVETMKNGTKSIRFNWERFVCLECHRDPHAGQFESRIDENGCGFCHTVRSWSDLKLDHMKTRFPLEGKHLAVACDRCHKEDSIGTAFAVRYIFKGIDCALCHTDPHRGQFVEPETGLAPCARCHTAHGWKPSIFSHDTQSRFPLTGGHAGIACEKCHPILAMEGEYTIRRYRPTDIQCISCHKDTRK